MCTPPRRRFNNEALTFLISRLFWGRLAYNILYWAYQKLKKRFYERRMGCTAMSPVFYEIKEEWLLQRMQQLGITNTMQQGHNVAVDNKAKAE